MKLSTIAIALSAALVMTGCGKKKDDKTPTTGTGAGTSAGTAAGTAAGTGAGTAAGTATPAPTPLAGDALAKHYLAGWEAWNAGDKVKFGALYAKDAVSHWPDSPMPERRGGDKIVEEAFVFRAGFPDAKSTAQLVLVNGRTIAAVWLTTGTNTGAMPTPMGEVPPSGKKIGQLLFHSVTFNDANQIADEWFVMDSNTLMAQLGMSPAPGRPVMEKGADAPTIVVATSSDGEKANLAMAQKGNDDFNKHDVAAMTATWADDAIESDQAAPEDTVGKAKIAEGITMFVGAFSDGKIAPISLWAAGDYVVALSTFTGTNDGAMGPMPKTGKPVKMTVAEVMRVDAGKVKQLWRFFDSGPMAVQLGLMPDPMKGPPPGGAGAPPAGAPPAGAPPAGAPPATK